MRFRVDGVPATKGSWRSFGKGNFVPDNKRERPWAQAVAWSAKAAGVELLTGAVHVEAVFEFPKPKRPANDFPARNDVDKLLRSALDALTHVAWNDDQQVVSVVASKRWAGVEGPGAWFRVVAM